MSRKSIGRSPVNFCPICGIRLGSNQTGHHCKPAVYHGIDAANTRAWNADLDERSDKSWHFEFPDYVSRLRSGFAMMADDFD